MNDLFLFLSILSFVAIIIYTTLAIIQFVKKDSAKSKKYIMFGGISGALMIVTFIGFGLTTPPTTEISKDSEKNKVETDAKPKEGTFDNASNQVINRTTKESKQIEKESESQKEQESNDNYTTFLNSIDGSTPEGKVRIAMYEVLKNDYEKPENVSISSDIDDEGHITAVGKGRDGWSNDSIRDGFFEDITNILRKIKDVDGYTSISISLTFPMQDTYGNINDDEVITMLFFKSEIDKIDFSSFNYINLPEVATGYRLYPAFQ